MILKNRAVIINQKNQINGKKISNSSDMDPTQIEVGIVTAVDARTENCLNFLALFM